MSALPMNLIRGSLMALGSFAVAAHAGNHDDRDKPAKEYTLTPIIATNNAQCEPGFAQQTFTRRIGKNGQVIGYKICYEATGIPETPFLFNSGWGYFYTPGSGSRLLPNIAAEGRGTFGRAFNEAGVAVGWEFTDTSLNAPVWLPSGGAMYAVEPDCTTAFPTMHADDINEHGSIAASGQRLTPSGCRISWILKRADGMEFVGPVGGRPDAINNHDVMSGQRINTAVKWSPTRGEIVLGQEQTYPERTRAYNINDREQAVGDWQHINLEDGCNSTSDAMYWEANGTAHVLEKLPNDTLAAALGINEHGLVVGYSETLGDCDNFQVDPRRAVLWHKGRVHDLNKRLKKSVAREIQLISASDINDRGQIAVFGFYRNRPLDKCWDIFFDPVTGEEFYDTTRMCRSIYAFLLTPKKDQ